MVLSTDFTTFYNNYHQFLNSLATAMEANINSITVNLITSGSVKIDAQGSTTFAPNSPAANQQKANLITTTSGSIAGMGVASSSVTANGASGNTNGGGGGSGSTSDGSLSRGTIILLATLIPVGALALVAAVVVLYCQCKKRREREEK